MSCSTIALLSACTPSSPDGTPAAAFVSAEVAQVARACVETGFDPAAVRARLTAEGWEENQRPGILQLESFPEGAGPLTQGVTAPSASPCAPRVNPFLAQEAIDAAGNALITAGFAPSPDPEIFVRGPERVLLRGDRLVIGQLVTIEIETAP